MTPTATRRLLRLPRIVVAVAVGIVVAAAAGLAAPAGIVAGPPAASIAYKLPKSTTLGEPTILRVVLGNSTGYRIVADFGVDDQTEFEFLHRKPDGTVERVRPERAAANRQRTSHLMLRGTSYTASVVLDDWLDLSQIGKHAIDVEFHGGVQIDGGDAAGVDRKKALAIDVKPHDSVRLRNRTAEWLKQVSTLSPDGETRAAAKALVHITDPVAIPSLELAVARTRQPMFVEALRAMNLPEAHAALERLSRSDDPDVRALAKLALSGRVEP